MTLNWRTLPYKMSFGIILGTLTRYGYEYFEITEPLHLIKLGAMMMVVLWLSCGLIDNHFEYKMLTKKQLEQHKQNIRNEKEKARGNNS